MYNKRTQIIDRINNVTAPYTHKMAYCLHKVLSNVRMDHFLTKHFLTLQQGES